jgi:hypothetical protein
MAWACASGVSAIFPPVYTYTNFAITTPLDPTGRPDADRLRQLPTSVRRTAAARIDTVSPT